MKILTCELTGRALDWAVAKWENADLRIMDGQPEMKFTDTSWREWIRFSTDGAQTAPIMERERINLNWDYARGLWCATMAPDPSMPRSIVRMYGPTQLVAAMRCYVASRSGDEIDIPKEVLK